MKNVLSKYQTGKVVIALDNARIHHANLIQPFLEQSKSNVVNNVFYSKVDEIRIAKNSMTFHKSYYFSNV